MKIELMLEGIPVSCDQFNMGVTNCILVTVDGKRILFNTGPFSERFFLNAKLKKMDLTFNDIDILVLSQIHFDTAMNADLFVNSVVYVHKAELDFALATPEKDSAMPTYLGRVIRKLPNLQVITGDTEIAEGVKIVELFGCTAGSIGLLAGDTLLAGGAVPTIRAAKQKEIYPCYYDDALAQESLEKALGMAEKIYPGYDRLFSTSDFTPLTEVGMRLRLFFSPSSQDQEFCIRSEGQRTFANWPSSAQMNPNQVVK